MYFDDDIDDWEYGAVESRMVQEGLTIVEPDEFRESVEEAATEVLTRLLDAAVALYAEASNISQADAWKIVLDKVEHPEVSS